MKILMVEDDAAVARALMRSFRIRGYEVVHVSTVQEGEEKLADPALDADVLLLDRQVMGEDGWSLRHVAPKRMRVVLMTGDPPKDAPPHFVKGGDLSSLWSMIEG